MKKEHETKDTGGNRKNVSHPNPPAHDEQRLAHPSQEKQPKTDPVNSTQTETNQNQTSAQLLPYLTSLETKTLLSSINNPRDTAIVTTFLHTGLFMRELISLTTDNINWEKRQITVHGKRERTLPLSDQAFDALARYSKERLDSQTNIFFTTERGKPRQISEQAMDSLLRSLGRRADLTKNINVQILRNTFGIHLATQETSVKRLSELLGISDPASIQKYIDTAKAASAEEEEIRALESTQIPGSKPQTPSEISSLESRPLWQQLLSRIIPIRPRQSRTLPHSQSPVTSSELRAPTLGRSAEISHIKENLSKQISTLLVGELGIGKSHFLNHIASELHLEVIDSPTPVRSLVTKLLDRYTPNWKEHFGPKAKPTLRDLADFLIATSKPELRVTGYGLRTPNHPILLIDNMEHLKITDADIFIQLFENFTILGATEDTPNRLKEIWWKFRRIDLKPLDPESSKELIKQLTQSMTVVDYDLLETRIMNFSHGYPLAIVDLVNQLHGFPVIKKSHIRDLYHEAGTKYRDWTMMVMVFWGASMMFRFVALGTHNFEWYILAGFAMAITMMARQYLMRMGRSR